MNYQDFTELVEEKPFLVGFIIGLGKLIEKMNEVSDIENIETKEIEENKYV